MSFLDTLFRYGGLAEITLLDANQTLSDDEASARVLKFVGTLTANRTITLPNRNGGDWMIFNATTGGYTLTIAGAQGGANVTVANGSREYVYYDSSGGVYATIIYDSSDLDTIGSTQGNILYRNASAWTALAPGTSGQYLRTSGTGANLSWAGGVSVGSVTITNSAGVDGQVLYTTDSINGIWVSQSSVWYPVVNSRLGTKPPTAGWTATNISGSGTTEVGFGAIEIQEASNGGADNWRYLRRSVGANTTFQAQFRADTLGSILYSGIGFRESAGGKMVILSLVKTAGSVGADPGQYYLSVDRWDNASTYNANAYQLEIGSIGGDTINFRMAISGTDLLFYYSADGYNYTNFLLHTEPVATHLGGAPDEVIFGINPYNGKSSAACLSWLEV